MIDPRGPPHAIAQQGRQGAGAQCAQGTHGGIDRSPHAAARRSCSCIPTSANGKAPLIGTRTAGAVSAAAAYLMPGGDLLSSRRRGSRDRWRNPGRRGRWCSRSRGGAPAALRERRRPRARCGRGLAAQSRRSARALAPGAPSRSNSSRSRFIGSASPEPAYTAPLVKSRRPRQTLRETPHDQAHRRPDQEAALAAVVRQSRQPGHDRALSRALHELWPHARGAFLRQAHHRHRPVGLGPFALQPAPPDAGAARARGHPRGRRHRLRIPGAPDPGDRQAAHRLARPQPRLSRASSRSSTAIRSTAWCSPPAATRPRPRS